MRFGEGGLECVKVEIWGPTGEAPPDDYRVKKEIEVHSGYADLWRGELPDYGFVRIKAGDISDLTPADQQAVLRAFEAAKEKYGYPEEPGTQIPGLPPPISPKIRAEEIKKYCDSISSHYQTLGEPLIEEVDVLEGTVACLAGALEVLDQNDPVYQELAKITYKETMSLKEALIEVSKKQGYSEEEIEEGGGAESRVAYEKLLEELKGLEVRG